jgi:hypothetical protein
VAGPGLQADPPRHGYALLRASTRGLVRIRPAALDRINARRGVLALTAPANRAVEAGAVVAAVKVTPLLLPARTVESVERIRADRGPAADVVPFRASRVAFVASARFPRRVVERARRALAARLAWFGSTLTEVQVAGPDPTEVAAALRAARDGGADLLLAGGGVATDPCDPLLQGLRGAGGVVLQIGVPVDPGTACWAGRLGAAPVLGLASCELFGNGAALELLLPRILAGERLDRRLLRSLAHGGLRPEGAVDSTADLSGRRVPPE